jgi:subtilase family serine protease/flagellar hook assembly protein FlgD/fibronectin type 3 domain-containing protein
MKRRFRTLAGLVVAVTAVVWAASIDAQNLFVRTIEDRDHVTIMEVGGIYDRQPEPNRAYEIAIREAIAKEFLRTHADDSDFLVTFTGFPYALGDDTEGAQVGGRYYALKNDIQGIGQELFDSSASFGSNGRLQGYIDMGALSRLVTDPTDPNFEHTLSILAHEFLHRWAAHIRFRDADGSLSAALLGREGAHWNFLLQSHNSVLYGNDWRDNRDGTFTSQGRSRAFYGPLDLYLMGMLDKSQVPPSVLIQNAAVDPTRLPELGVTIQGTPKTITIDDIVAAEGERVPSAQNAPKQFKMAFIFLVRPGEQAHARDLRSINALRDAFATRFAILTGGNGIVQVFPEQPREPLAPPVPTRPPSSGPRTAPLDLVQSVDWLLSRQLTDGAWGDSPATRVRDSVAALDLLQQIPSTYLAHQKGLAWLTALKELPNVDAVSRRLIALAPQFSPSDSAFLTEARNPNGGWGLARGYQSDPLDTALALLALPQGDAAAALSYLLSTQNSDGGWGIRPDSPSSVATTLAAIDLGTRYQTADFTRALERALAWLRTRQNDDGGFGSSPSTGPETAQAVLALVNTTFPKADLARALDYLRRTQLADGSWSEGVYDTALAIRALKTGELPNLSVIPSSLGFSPATPTDGDVVTINARLANDSLQDVQNVVATFYAGDPAAGGVLIGSSIVIASLPALAEAPVSVLWDTTNKPGPHQIWVVVDPDGAIEEFDEVDNRTSKGITVRPPPVEPDLVIKAADLAFTPDLLRGLPQSQTLQARVANVGQTAATGVGIALYDGDPAAGGALVAETIADVPGRGATDIAFQFTVSAPVERRYFVAADPARTVAEADETNNVAFRVLPVQPAVDLFAAPGGITLSENPVALGRDLLIQAQVGNSGTADAFAARVRVFIDDPAGAIDVATPTIDLPAGQTRTIQATWRTSRTLTAPLVVDVDPLNAFTEPSETNNRASSLLTVPASTQANLRVTRQELHVTSPVLQGGTATISIPVYNTGFADAANVAVTFYAGVPGSGGVQIGATLTIASLAPGTQSVASVVWDPITTFGQKIIYVVVDQVGAIVEFDEQDNTAFVNVDVLSLPDLAVSSASLSFIPAFPKPGEPVMIAVSVGNLGKQTAANVSVRFFQGDPASGGVAIAAEQFVQVPGGAQAAAQVVYMVGAAGVPTIFVVVDAPNQVPELDETNNVASRTLGIQDASLFFSNLYFSPNGDEVQDRTEFFFRAAEGGAASVQVIDRDGREVRLFALTPGSPSDSVEWDGKDDLGRVVADGQYTFAVNAGDRRIASATVVVDTNNSPVGDAAGTRYLVQDNLTCDARGVNSAAQFANVSPNFNHVGWLPDDTGLVSWVPTQMRCPGGFYYYRCGFEYVSSPQVGVYITSPDGQRVRITPDSWTGNAYAGSGTEIAGVVPSPDGRKILIALRRSRTVFDVPGWIPLLQYFGPAELWVIDSGGSGLVQIGALPRAVRNDPQGMPEVAWSPDARFVSVLDHGNNVNNEVRLYTIAAAGGSQTVIRSTPFGAGGGPFDVRWSGDGRLVYQYQTPSTFENSAYAVDPDGTNPVVLPWREGMSFTTAMWIAADRFVNQIWDPSGRTSRLHMFFLNGDEPMVLTPGVHGSGEAVLAPGGGAIVFSDRVAENWPESIPEQASTGIWRVDAEGNVERLYTASIQNRGIHGLSWTRDARRIAFYEQVITDFKTCPGSEGGFDFCGESFTAVGTIDVADRAVRVVATDADGIDIIGFFPDGNSFLATDETGLIAFSLEDGRRTTLFKDDRIAIGFPSFGFTPSGKYFIYHSQRDSRAGEPCYKGGFGFYDTFILSSLLNLSTDLAFQRDRSQLLVRGTAEDRNFASYTLEAAPVSQPDQWTPIAAPSDTSVIGGPLASWVPSSEGTFIVRLTATDLAGNREIVRKRVTWGLTPTITNVTVTPRTFSPNGDGTKDSTTVGYVVLGPVNLEFTIFDAQDELVRSIPQAHPVIGPASIPWNGRDDAGQVVPDGVYRIHVLDYDFFVTVDTTPPDARLSLGGAFRTVAQKTACVKTSTGLSCSTFPGPVVDTPSHALTGRAHDANLAAWRLEVSNTSTPSEWVFVNEGTDVLAARDSSNRPVTPIADTIVRALPDVIDVLGKRYRLTATDQAGNVRTIVADLAPQELILHAWDGVPAPTIRTLEQALGPHVLSAVHTIRAVQRVTLEYRLSGSSVWVNGAELLSPAGQFELPWSNAALAGGRTYEVRLLGRDVDGGEYASNALSIHSDLFEFTNVETSPFLRTTKTTGVRSLSEGLTNIRLVLAVEGDPDIGMTAAVFSDPVTFSIQVAPDQSLDGCASVAVPARYKGIGEESGRVYYSNTRSVTRFGPPGKTCTSTSRGALLELAVARVMPADCSVPNPELVQIRLTGTPGVRAGTVRLSMQNVPNGPLGEGSVVTLPFDRNLDTKQHAEGTYLVRATATAEESAGGGPLTASATFVVDHTPPSPQITYPATNQLLCPSRTGSKSVVTVEGVADDPNFDHFVVEYGIGDAPVAWFPVMTSQTPKRGPLADWDVTTLTAGTYTLRLTVFDKGGNVHCVTTTFTLQGGLRLENVRADSPFLSPNGDGNQDSVGVAFTLDVPALVDAHVFAVQSGVRAQTPLRTLLVGAQHLAGSNTILWDGLSDLGAAVPDGVYHVVLTARDACGNPVSSFAAIEADSTLPDALIASPVPGETNRVSIEVRGSVGDLHFSGYRLEVGEGAAPLAWTAIATGRAPVSSGLLGTWNTRAQPGVYTLRLTATDAAGNRREALTSITVSAGQPLIDSLAVQPAVFSPNGDNRMDIAFIEYVTTAAARIVIEVLSGDSVVATLLPEHEAAPGAYAPSWRGMLSGAPFADGEYAVRVKATSTTDAGRVQTEIATVIVDTTAPGISVATPAAAVQMRGDVDVAGTVVDAHIDAYTVSYGTASAGPTVVVDEGGQSRTDHLFTTLRGLSDGAYLIRITASDVAGNAASLDRAFGIDNQSPGVALLSPETGAIAGGSTTVLDVRGSVTEPNLQQWTLRFGAGLDPAQWTTIVAQATPPASDQLASWDTTGIADGIYTLSLQAIDRAGAMADVRVQVVVDHTAPVATIRQPADGGRISGAFEIRGDASDANFKLAALDISEGAAATAARFTPLATLEEPVTDGLLFPMGTPPVDGTYTLRLTVEDDTGQRTERLATIVVDTEPLASPSNLVAAIENGNAARLTWLAPSGEGIAGYNLYRGERKLNSVPILATTYLDQNLIDGTHRYTVTVVDAGNLESDRSNEATVAVDLTPPAVQIQSPQNGAIVGDLVDVRGTAASADDFREYRLLVGEGAAPASFTLIRKSPAPVTSSLLTQWDTALLPQGAVRTLLLEAEDLRGNKADVRVTVTIDNAGPAAPVLLAVTQTGTSLTATWQASPEPDLAGYLLYNGDLLANVDRQASGNLTPYLLQGTSFADTGLLDGLHRYVVVAVDRGGNQSAPSNAVEAVLETRPPRATIVQPADGTSVDAPVTLVATSPDLDIASVQFQYRPTTTSVWTNLGALVTAPPFSVSWDPRPLPQALYLFRAVGTDVRGNTDTVPNIIPPMVSIRHRDVTSPAPPTSLSARVTGGTVSLSWTASPATDVKWYNVVRGKVGGSLEGAGRVPATATSFDDPDRADGLYTYYVQAEDTGFNQSTPTNDVLALVYSIQLTTPALCIPEPFATMQGSGAPGGTTVILFAGDGPAASPIATAQTDADGRFQFPGVPLLAGPNVFTAEASDASGNRSKRARSLTVAYQTLPGALPSLGAEVIDHDVRLFWTPADAAAGYGVYRNGIRLGLPADVTSRGVATASSEHPNGHVASRAMDGDANTFWVADWTNDPSPWWQLQFPAAVHVREVRVQFAFLYASDFQVQRWDGSAWAAIATVAGNTQSQNVITLDPPIAADRLRIVITGAPFEAAFFGEVQILAIDAVNGTTFTDANRPDGRYTYAVRGLSACGLDGPAREVEVAVGDVTAPAAPAGLTATAIGSTVGLEWTPNVEADLAGYHVYRQTADGNWLRLTPAPIAIAAFADPLLQNGVYRYRVTAIDAIGNESEPSAEVQALVAAAAPGPPSLTAVAPAEGGAIDLVWAPDVSGAPAGGYILSRSLTAGGPYTAVHTGLLTGPAYRDPHLTNGTAYYYVIVAVDAAGNRSNRSNEASATPADGQAPAAPVLGYPTDASRALTLGADRTTIAGSAEAGAAVALLQSGLTLATATASTSVSDEEFRLQYNQRGDPAVHPSALLLGTLSTPPGESERKMAVTNLLTRETRYYESTLDGSAPAFSADRTRMAYVASDDQTLHVVDLATDETIHAVALAGDVAAFALSPDGSRAAVAVDDPNTSSDPLLLVNLSTSASTPIATDESFDLVRWLPGGERVLYGAGGRLVLVDAVTGATTIVDDMFTEELDVSPDGSLVAFTSERGGSPDIWLYNVASGTLAVLPADSTGLETERRRPVFSLNGVEVAYLAETSDSDELLLRTLRLDAGAAETIADGLDSDTVPFWTGDQTIVLIDDEDVTRILLPGRVQFDNVLLAPGANVFSAVATDAAGNTSAPAAAITLLREAGALSDLVIRDQDFFVYPLFPASGERVRIAATVRNTGSLPAAGVTLMFFDENQQGDVAVVGAVHDLGTIAPGATAAVTADWVAAGEGVHRLRARVDPLGAIPEQSETNNSATREATVGTSALPSVRVSVGRASYGADNPVDVVVTAANPGASADFVLDVTVEDALGNPAATILHRSLTAFPYGTREFTGEWAMNGALAGDYRARATLRRSDGLVATAAAPFSVVPDEHVVLSLSTDRAAYLHGDTVRVSGAVRNASANVDVSDVSSLIEILGSDGTLIQQSGATMGTLLIGAQASVSAAWGATTPGTYTVRLTARQGARLLGGTTRSFTVTGTARIGGALSVEQPAVPMGDDFAVTAALSNTGSLGLNGLIARLRLFDPETRVTLRSYERTVDLTAGASIVWPLAINSAGLAIKSYTLVLEVVRPGPVVETLATTTASVSVLDLGAPVVQMVTPAPDQYRNQDVPIVARVRDDLSAVIRVELRIDGGAWLQMAPADPAAGTFSHVVGASASTEGFHTITVRAVDAVGNGENTSSTDANPATASLTIDVTLPQIVVAGVSDGQSYQTAVTPQITVTDANPSSQTIRLNGVPFVSGTPISTDGAYALDITATDRAGNVSTRSIHFIVNGNQPPIAIKQALTTSEDTPVAAILAATDPDGDALTFIITSPAHGTLSGQAPSLTYTPAADFYGADQFTFKVSDGTETSAEAIVSIQVTPVNDPPVANAGANQSVTEGATAILNGSGSTDKESSALIYRWRQTSGVPAVIDLLDPARPTFRAPEVSRSGSTLTFELIVNDGVVDSAAAQVNVVVENVNKPPLASNQSLTTDEDTPVIVILAATDPDGDALTFLITPPAHGMLSGEAPSLTYTPATDFYDADQFTFRVSDGTETSTEAIVSIQVTPVNDPPVANAGANQSVMEGATAILDGSGSTDKESDGLTYRWRQTAGLPAVLDLLDPARPTFRAPEVPGSGSTLTFELIVNDSVVDSAPAHVNVVVDNVNKPPLASNQHLTTNEDTPVGVELAVSDPDEDPLTFEIQPPTGGALGGIAPNLTYTPARDFDGADQFTFTVRDPAGLGATATVFVTITPVNDRPVARAGADQAVNEGDVVTLDGSASDVEGDPLTFAWTQVAGPAVTLQGSDTARPTFIAPEAPVGGMTLTFRLVASDGQAQSDAALVNVLVKNVNHAPVAEAGPDQRVGTGVQVTLDGSASYDQDGDPVTYAWRQVAGVPVDLAGQTAAIASFIAPNSRGVLTFELTASDGVAASVDLVNVSVESSNHSPIADAGPDQVVREGDNVGLDGRGSLDPDGDPLTYWWTQVSGTPVSLRDRAAPLAAFTAPPVPPLGETLSFELEVSDLYASSAKDRVDVRVLPSQSGPSCSTAQASPSSLWPPNHKLIAVRIVGLSDSSATVVRIDKVTQDEPVDGKGDGDTSPDAFIDGGTVSLRAERAGNGNGRVYRIAFTATKRDHGASCVGSVSVEVRHNPQKPSVDDGQRYLSTQRDK